jgi:hypothetical protein
MCCSPPIITRYGKPSRICNCRLRSLTPTTSYLLKHSRATPHALSSCTEPTPLQFVKLKLRWAIYNLAGNISQNGNASRPSVFNEHAPVPRLLHWCHVARMELLPAFCRLPQTEALLTQLLTMLRGPDLSSASQVQDLSSSP